MFPAGTIPAIDDNGFQVFEMAAILIYLCEKHGWKDWYGNTPESRGAVNQYLHWHHGNTRKITTSLFAPIVRKDLKIPLKTVRDSREGLVAMLAKLEQIMGAKYAALSKNPLSAV